MKSRQSLLKFEEIKAKESRDKRKLAVDDDEGGVQEVVQAVVQRQGCRSWQQQWTGSEQQQQ